MRKNLTIVFLSLSFLIPTASHAARDYGINRAQAFFGQVYLGLKYGRLTIAEDVPDEDGADIRNMGFTFGKGINDHVATEFSYNFTVTEDENDSGDISADSIGFFVVGKTKGAVYVKGRLGYTRLTLERNFAGSSFDHNAYGIAYGLALGARVGPGAIELEYTVLPEIEDDDFVGAPIEVESDFLSVAYVWGFE